MASFADFIRNLSPLDAELFEKEKLELIRTEIYKKIYKIDRTICKICNENPKEMNNDNYCSDCSLMASAYESKSGDLYESVRTTGKYINWVVKYIDKDRARYYFNTNNFYNLMHEYLSTPANKETKEVSDLSKVESSPTEPCLMKILSPSDEIAKSACIQLIRNKTDVDWSEEIRSCTKSNKRKLYSSNSDAAILESSNEDEDLNIRPVESKKEIKASSYIDEHEKKNKTASGFDNDRYNGQPNNLKKHKRNRCVIERCKYDRISGPFCGRHYDCKKCLLCRKYRAEVKKEGDICLSMSCREDKKYMRKRKDGCAITHCYIKSENNLCEKHKNAKKCALCSIYCKYLKKDGEKCNRCKFKSVKEKNMIQLS